MLKQLYHAPENGHNLIFQGVGNSGSASLSEAIMQMAVPSGFLYLESGMLGNPDLTSMAKAIMEVARKNPATNRFLTHHFCFGVDKYLPGVSVYITMCRQPVRQMLSVYAYIQDFPAEFSAVFQNATLEEFIAFYEKHTTNMTFSEFFTYHAMNEAQQKQYTDLLNAGSSEAPQYMYDFVNTNYALVGITELMEEYLVMVSLLFMQHWPTPWVRNRQKKSKTRVLEKSDPLYKKLEATLPVDMALYNAFRTQFNALFSEFMESHAEHEEKFLAYKVACVTGDDKIRAAFEKGEEADYLSDYILSNPRRLAVLRSAVMQQAAE